MTLRRPPAPFLSFLLIFQGLTLSITECSYADESISEAVPQGVDVDNVNEPRAEIKESPFRQVTRTVRKKTDDPLIELCKETVEVTSRRMLSTELHTPWQMIHALLGLRNEFHLLHNGQTVSGLDWIAEGQTYENEYWFERTKHGGRAHPYSRPYAFEGHANQTIALISMCGVELDREFGTADGTVTMRDMIRHAQMTITPKDEPTWTLWALSRYLPPSARWQTENGEQYSIERLVQEQVAKPMQGAPCGGTHGLFALAHARNVYLQQGKPLRGVWLQAEYKIRQYINTARVQQNSDGSLSSNYFRGRAYDPDFNKRMASVGHVLEFLMIALPQNELNSQWVRRAVHSAATELMNNRKAYVKCSPLYHTVNALNIYLDRVNPAEPENVAVKEGTKTVQVDKPESSKVPAKTVSQPKVVAETPKESENEVIILAPVEKAAPMDITPKEDADPTELKVEHSVPKPVVEDGQWKATPVERQQPINVPEELTGGAKVSPEAEVKHEKAAVVAPVETKQEQEQQQELKLPATAPVRVPAPEPTAPMALTLPAAVDSPVTEPATSQDATSESEEAESEEAATEESPAVEPAVESSGALVVPAEPQPASVVTITDPSLGLSADHSDSALSAVPEFAMTTEAIATDVLSPSKIAVQATDNVRDAIVNAMQIRSGMSVAQVGSGDGSFVAAIAKAVGSEGQLFAIDDSADRVEQLESMVEQTDLANVHVVRNDDESLQLMTRRVDMVLLSDKYQQLKKPVSIVSSIQRTLKPGGEFVLVESRMMDQTERSTIIKTVVDAGFEYVSEMNVPGFESGTYLRFKRRF